MQRPEWFTGWIGGGPGQGGRPGSWQLASRSPHPGGGRGEKGRGGTGQGHSWAIGSHLIVACLPPVFLTLLSLVLSLSLL